jgi:hypothetical protein
MTKMNRFYAAVLVAALPWLAGCETFGGVYNVPKPVIAAGDSLAEPLEETALPTDAASEAEPRPGFERLSPLPVSGRGLVQEDWSDRFPDDDEISVAVEDMPLSQFLHYAFGELLGVNYLLSDGLTNLEAPVTLNLQDSVSSRRLYAVATELLAGRDVGVTFRDDIYYLHPVDRRGKSDVFIGFGASAEDIPEVPGPIMQIIPLRYGLSASLERTLRDLVDAKVVGDVEQGALFVTGERFEIQRGGAADGGRCAGSDRVGRQPIGCGPGQSRVAWVRGGIRGDASAPRSGGLLDAIDRSPGPRRRAQLLYLYAPLCARGRTRSLACATARRPKRRRRGGAIGTSRYTLGAREFVGPRRRG